jgi:hypothetical protein
METIPVMFDNKTASQIKAISYSEKAVETIILEMAADVTD